MKKNDAFRRAAALIAALSITVSLAAPAFAETYYIDDGDITITKNEDGSQTIQQGDNTYKDDAGEETVITTHDQTIRTQESDLEGPAAEDSGFGPVVEDNYQPAQPESAEEPKDADQPENTDRSEDADQPESADQPENTDRQEDADRQESADQLENTDQPKDAEEPEGADQPESADQQAQPQQAAPAPAAAPAAPAAPTSVITLINNFANTVLNLTLKDVKIDVSDTGKYGRWGTSERGKAALSVQGNGNVEIELDGKNELKSDVLRAGLEKTSTGTLTLKDDNQKAGSLTATGNYNGAGIGGGSEGEGKKITINGGSVTATGGKDGAGIGGGDEGEGKKITINGDTVNATGGKMGAGIGGGREGKGSNVTVSGAAQVTTTAGKSKDFYYGAGATIGNGGDRTGGETVDGEEIQADISGVTTGYIHHIIYDQDLILDDNSYAIVREWWEPVRPDGESRLDLHVETLEGDPLPFNAQQQGSTLRVTTDNLSARLHGTRQALEALREQGVEQIQFVTTLKTTTLSVEDLLAEGGSWFALEHDGLVSRQLSAAQAESLKCWMH